MHAAPAHAPLASWVRCEVHLDWATATHVTHQTCHRYPIRKATSRPTGATHACTQRSPHVRVCVTYPTWPVSMLPVCYPDTVRQWSAFIFAASARTGIPAGWLAAMVWRESGGYPDVRSVGGDGYDIGLLQFGPDEVAYVQRAYHFGAYTYDPATNILTGAGYLEYLRQFDAGGNLYTATIEYNGGFLNPPAPTAVAYEEWVAAHDCL